MTANPARAPGHPEVAHLLAHAWFGQQLGMSKWDRLWTNPGFSSAVADLAEVHGSGSRLVQQLAEKVGSANLVRTLAQYATDHPQGFTLDAFMHHMERAAGVSLVPERAELRARSVAGPG
jgi:aminopeptidase N